MNYELQKNGGSIASAYFLFHYDVDDSTLHVDFLDDGFAYLDVVLTEDHAIGQTALFDYDMQNNDPAKSRPV